MEEWLTLPKTREEAASSGGRFYYTGVACSKGHFSPRYTSTKQCKECLDVWTDEWRSNNPGRAQETSEEWRKRNSDHVLSLARKRYAETEAGEKSRERARRWREENPDAVRLQTRKRRARKKGNGGEHSTADVLDLLTKQRSKCAECGKSIKDGYEVDHIMPLSKGGTDNRSNLQLLCKPCNQSKGAKHPIDWAKQKGRLV